MEKQFDTPVLLLVFNRLDTVEKVFEQIRIIRPKYLFIAADGPRDTVAGEKEKCEAVRNIIHTIDWDCELKQLFREKNLGCGPAVSSAITWFFDHVEAGIILEDDCYPDLSFFPFCNELLSRYATAENVRVIGGNNYQKNAVQYPESYNFSHYPHTWGWATWKRSWKYFNFDVADFEESFAAGKLDHVFQSEAEKNYWRKKFHEVVLFRKNIWDYQFLYSIWLNKGISITPKVNLVTNIGLDNDFSTHKFLKDSVKSTPIGTISFPLIHPTGMDINRKADYHTFTNFFSHSPKRMLRLIRENGIVTILKYAYSRIKK